MIPLLKIWKGHSWIRLNLVNFRHTSFRTSSLETLLSNGEFAITINGSRKSLEKSGLLRGRPRTKIRIWHVERILADLELPSSSKLGPSTERYLETYMSSKRKTYRSCLSTTSTAISAHYSWVTTSIWSTRPMAAKTAITLLSNWKAKTNSKFCPFQNWWSCSLTAQPKRWTSNAFKSKIGSVSMIKKLKENTKLSFLLTVLSATRRCSRSKVCKTT